MRFNKIFCLSILALTPSFHVASVRADQLDQWIPTQAQRSLDGIFTSISHDGAARGSVVASPWKDEHKYFYHWIRDAALVMNTVVTLYESEHGPRRASYFTALMDYITFSRRNQLTPNRSGQPWSTGLGEPKFNPDGSSFEEGWGRPQNDGPALRAVTLIHLSKILIKEGYEDLVRLRLYDGKIPTETVIKADLEYVAHHWRESGFDLWEEVKGQHFYTRMVQRRSLLEGASLAEHLGDRGAADFYRSQAVLLSQEILKHWNPQRGVILPTLYPEMFSRSVGAKKSSDLDIAVVLAALHGCAGDGFFCPTSDPVLSSAEKIRSAFHSIYAINRVSKDGAGESLGTAIGRYPEDTYDGLRTDSVGNPWYLATNALAELYYRAGRQWAFEAKIPLTPAKLSFFRTLGLGNRQAGPQPGQVLVPADPRFGVALRALRKAGDDQLRRTKFHAPSTSSLAEQFNRSTGFFQGARDLTWSYASFLTAIWSR